MLGRLHYLFPDAVVLKVGSNYFAMEEEPRMTAWVLAV